MNNNFNRNNNNSFNPGMGNMGGGFNPMGGFAGNPMGGNFGGFNNRGGMMGGGMRGGPGARGRGGMNNNMMMPMGGMPMGGMPGGMGGMPMNMGAMPGKLAYPNLRLVSPKAHEVTKWSVKVKLIRYQALAVSKACSHTSTLPSFQRIKQLELNGKIPTVLSDLEVQSNRSRRNSSLVYLLTAHCKQVF